MIMRRIFALAVALSASAIYSQQAPPSGLLPNAELITEWKTGEWHQIAGSWDGSTFQLYFDGELVRETTISNPFFLPEKPRMLVGSDFPQNRPVAPGIVGGLEVHKRPLSRHEVMKRFVGPVG